MNLVFKKNNWVFFNTTIHFHFYNTQANRHLTIKSQVINLYGWIHDSFHHDALVFDLHQKIEVVEHMAFEKPWLD